MDQRDKKISLHAYDEVLGGYRRTSYDDLGAAIRAFVADPDSIAFLQIGGITAIDRNPKTGMTPVFKIDAVVSEYRRVTTEMNTADDRKFVVDGVDRSGNFSGDGEFPPFVVFDVDRQENIAGPFATRHEGESARLSILAGDRPVIDKALLASAIGVIEGESENVDDEMRIKLREYAANPSIAQFELRRLGEDLSGIAGEVLGYGLPDWPDTLKTFQERLAYQKGVAHARYVDKEIMGSSSSSPIATPNALNQATQNASEVSEAVAQAVFAACKRQIEKGRSLDGLNLGVIKERAVDSLVTTKPRSGTSISM